jgi:hypothetical protein
MRTRAKLQSIDRPDPAVIVDEVPTLALATCDGGNGHREAARLRIDVQAVEVEAPADWGAVGRAATNVICRARVSSGGRSRTGTARAFACCRSPALVVRPESTRP